MDQFSRRAFLGAAAGLVAPPRRVRIGIRTVVYQARPMAEAARLIREQRIEGVQLGTRFADVRFNPDTPDWTYFERARDVFGAAGLTVAAYDGYVRLLQPSAEARRLEAARLAAVLENAGRRGIPVVATETGYSRDPKERAPAGESAGVWKDFISTIRGLAKRAEAGGTVLAIEPSFATFLNRVELVRRMLDEAASPHLRILWDGAHLLDASALAGTGPQLEAAWTAFGREVVIAHANDACPDSVAGIKSCPPGEGKLDYRKFVSLLARSRGELFLCLEHATEPDVPRLARLVDGFLAEVK